jgi:hypothetical protein
MTPGVGIIVLALSVVIDRVVVVVVCWWLVQQTISVVKKRGKRGEERNQIRDGVDDYKNRPRPISLATLSVVSPRDQKQAFHMALVDFLNWI